MKKCFIINLFLFISFSSKSQTYDSLVVNNALWIINGDLVTTPYPNDTCIGYYIDGDSIDGGYTYKKVYRLTFLNHNASQFNPIWVPYNISSSVLYALIRENSKIAYAKKFNTDILHLGISCPNNLEYELYDFNILNGDTLIGCINNQYSIVDSTLYPSLFGHEAWHFNNPNPGNYIIEGIGSNFGLFEPTIPSFSSTYQFQLVFYCKGDFQSCGIGFTGIKNSPELSAQSIKILNDSGNSLQIITPVNSVFNFEIYSMDGKIVFSSNLKGTSNELNTKKFNSGIYFCKLILDDIIIIKKIKL